jgi:mRNA-degrading endonuclease RelE of RelBE toxin-antitoxin system
MKMMINFEELPDFKKDLKRLIKKYRTLAKDLEPVRRDLNDDPDARPPFSFRIEGLGITTCVIKMKKIASDSFKGRGVNSGFRLIYAYFKKEGRIVLIELFHKNEKENEDRERILKNFKEINQSIKRISYE